MSMMKRKGMGMKSTKNPLLKRVIDEESVTADLKPARPAIKP